MSFPARRLGEVWTLESLAEYVSEIVAKESGNVLGPAQQSMVASRLRKRLLDMGSISPQEYYNHLSSNYKDESTRLVSMLTTHHTFFFREFSHFEFIAKNLDAIVERVRARGENKIQVLSAACSRGQEVYSLAMFLEHHLKRFPGMSYEITGTDIDPESVALAANGVYPYREVKTIPQLYLEGNWQRGRGDISDFARVKTHLKEKCSFKVMNLLRIAPVMAGKKFDLVFCRNVFIYFKADDITKIVNDLKNYIHAGGMLLTGLSESLKEMGIEMQTHAPSVYSFDKAPVKAQPQTSTAPRFSSSPIPSPVRVLVVDDSPSVVKLLSRIFEADPEFALAGTAGNGKEAAEFLKNNKVDAMTLDIHMPEMDGVEYLKANHRPGHPKVIVVSSASREDTRYAQETLRHGASDFVEKPALNNLAKRAEEIKNKIKMAFLNERIQVSALDTSFRRDFIIQNPSAKTRLLFANFSDLKKVKSSLNELTGAQPATFLVFEGNGNYLEMIRDELAHPRSEVFVPGANIQDGKVYLCDFEQHMQLVAQLVRGKKTSCSVFGICSKALSDSLLTMAPGQLLLEDLPKINEDLKNVATDIFPWTSFSHVATEFLAKDENGGITKD